MQSARQLSHKQPPLPMSGIVSGTAWLLFILFLQVSQSISGHLSVFDGQSPYAVNSTTGWLLWLAQP